MISVFKKILQVIFTFRDKIDSQYSYDRSLCKTNTMQIEDTLQDIAFMLKAFTSYTSYIWGMLLKML